MCLRAALRHPRPHLPPQTHQRTPAPDPEPVAVFVPYINEEAVAVRIRQAAQRRLDATPDPLAAAGHTEQTTRQTHHEAVQHRNQLIRQAVQNGRTLREVGEAVGLSHVAVRNIAEKETKP